MYNLSSIAPKFLVPSKQIKILKSPVEFYTYICERMLQSRNRVFISSLYLGNQEIDFVNTLNKSLSRNKELRVCVLLDALRGTRESPQACSASLLSPLIAKFQDRFELRLYKTPKLSKFMEKVLPKRVVEGAGLNHMKIYGFDDEVVLSGANLSKDYFTNKQDRYISFQNKDLADFYHEVHKQVSNISHNVVSNQPADFLVQSTTQPIKPSIDKLKQLLNPRECDLTPCSECIEVYPVFQFTPLGLGTEFKALSNLAAECAKSSVEWVITSGYFNFYPKLAKKFAKTNNGTVIIASQQANGFYNSAGMSKHIPHVYALAARKFLSKCKYTTRMREWSNGTVNLPNGWSYHAKGIWLLNSQRTPLATYIGSSNFTYRSYLHDLECGAILCKPGGLPVQFKYELENLQTHCGKPLTKREVAKPSLMDYMFFYMFRNRL